jgi:1-acyl-sn-glycerol-3-phosphate acyltransferase
LNLVYRILYPFIWFLGFLLCVFLGPIRWRRDQKWPSGPLLILSNHLSDCDPVFVHIAAIRPVHFMAKSELFEMKLLGPFIKFVRAFPVQRGKPDRTAIRHAVDLLKGGERVGMFPEGQLSETGELQPVLPGAGLIVKMAEAPVVCCGLRNTNRVIPYGKYIPRPIFRFVDVHFGEVRRFGDDATTEEIVAWVESEFKRLTAK